MRIAVIKESECQAPENCDYICAEVCPRVREGAKETVYARENGKAAITESLCISCGICVKRCPFDAIRIINLPDEMMKDVTFQYGINTFRTFNIATPIAGKVLGLIGRNGIGKTTNINLISGSIKPNFGEYKKEFTDTEIIRRFRGKDIQPFLEKLYSGTLRIAKKPQEFTINGHVREYLKKDRFGIVGQEILGKEASVLSGGESQLVEIARTMDEEEDTYIFDEPMNYLDVFNRIKVAQMIKEKLKDKTVVLVEHDLIMLDYMADFIQILYGSDSNYGIVSHIMPTRNGINNYISGYLPTENVRFREYQIKIKKTANLEGKKTAFKWPDFSVDLGNFRLDVSAGSISEGEIVGIIGRNGIGKSTFIKALAGLVKTSLGDLDFGARIAYKPQINRKGRSMTVDEAFEVVKAGYLEDEGINTIINKLEVRGLLKKKLETLSGGETQKVAIISTIMKDADIFLFDEPSASLDVEDRLEVLSIISSFMSSKEKCGLIVDHDILFLDSVCSRSILFDGVPGAEGKTRGITTTRNAINEFLKGVDVTMRRDSESGRPRINQKGSRLDKEQKTRGVYFED